jgi:D-glycero-beta-D-manno-heptose 1-phosphate adenylyltransferase
LTTNAKHGFAKKIVPDYVRLDTFIRAHRALGHRIVLTIGSWDLLHIGHVRYLNAAKVHGDILLVGVDSDVAIKRYKGPLRPVVPAAERVEMLSYQASVDYVTLVEDVNEAGEWEYGLLKLVRPEIFVAVEESYRPGQIEVIKDFADEIVILPRQAENTSTSKLVQNTVKKQLGAILDELEARDRSQ